jgi:hypothetical protein
VCWGCGRAIEIVCKGPVAARNVTGGGPKTRNDFLLKYGGVGGGVGYFTSV